MSTYRPHLRSLALGRQCVSNTIVTQLRDTGVQINRNLHVQTRYCTCTQYTVMTNVISTVQISELKSV